MKAIAISGRGRWGILGSSVALFALMNAATALAGTEHGNWESRSADGKCWAVSFPLGDNAGGERGPAYASIQNQPGEGVRGSVAVVSGNIETGRGEVSLEVDGKRFEMLPYGDGAFARSGSPESSLISAMRKGREMKVTWTLASGVVMVDTYSMQGFSSAKAEIDRMCN